MSPRSLDTSRSLALPLSLQSPSRPTSRAPLIVNTRHFYRIGPFITRPISNMVAPMMLPAPQGRRLVQLLGGLVLYGVSDSMLLLAGLGADPWDVLQQGLSRQLGLGVGTWAIIVGAAVLVLWIPLRQRPGMGTLANVAVIGSTIDLVMWLLPTPHDVVLRWATMLAGVGLNGVATGAYIGAGLGPGPRDGLMTGMASRGHSIRVVRSGIEISVLAIGWILGGTVGIGTLAYAAAIGPLAHVFIPLLGIRE